MAWAHQVGRFKIFRNAKPIKEDGLKMKKLFSFLLVLTMLCFAVPSASLGVDGNITVTLQESKKTGPQLPHTSFMMPDKTVVYKLLAGIGTSDYSDLVNVFRFMEIEQSKKLQVILNSPGGSLFDGMALAGLIQEKVKAGYEVEVRGYGIIASAATLIMISGTPGKRYMDPNSLLMVHELSVFEYSYKNVSSKEKEVAILRFIQSNTNKFVARLTGIDPKKLEELCKEETWLDPARAVELGFADKVL